MSTVCQICVTKADTYLCGAHRLELVDALSQLGGTTVDGRPRQGLYEDLLDTCWRLDHTGAPLAAVRSLGTRELPLPSERAAELRDQVANTVTTWAREVAERHPHLELPSTVPAACIWLAAQVGLIEEHPAAGEVWRDIVPLPGRILRTIDRRPTLTFLGICSAFDGGGVCVHDIYADLTTGATMTQCARCGTWHDIAHRRTVLLRAVDDQLLTATELHAVLSRCMPHAPAVGTIWRWASTGRLARRPPHPHQPREPRYRMGDVLDLIARSGRYDTPTTAA